MQLKHKLPLILVTAYVVLTGTLVVYALANSSKTRKVSQFEVAKSNAQNYSSKVKIYISKHITELRSLESGIALMANLDDKTKAEYIGKLLKKLAEQPAISDAYAVFERGEYFSKELTDPGFYYNIEAFRPLKGGIEVFNEESSDIADDDDWYNIPKKTKRNHLAEPYKWTYPGETKEREMISLSYPVFVNGKFVGVLGIDMELTVLQRDLFDGMKDSKMGAYTVLVSNEGIIAAHPKKEMLFAPIDADTPESERQKLREAISKGEYYPIFRPEQNGDNSIISYVPMKPKELDTPWSIGYVVSHSALRGEELGVRYRTIALLFVIDILWGLFLIWLMSNVFGPLTRAVASLGKMTKGDGDLTIRLEESGKDEIGQMSRGLNNFIEKLHFTIKTMQQEAKSLLNTSSTLYEFSEQLSNLSQTALDKSSDASNATEAASEGAKAIASGADRTSSNANELASVAEQMSANMNSVASAVEEMSASICEIASNTAEANSVAIDATAKATEATAVMSKLGSAAKEIGRVTDVIKKIADKTNLLALNATIEAASAGEAGKGFTVVAGEIKELANQSAKNADDIDNRVESIQSGTNNAIDVIKSAADIISKINGSIHTIASNVEQQTLASGEIARNAEQTSTGSKRVVSAISEIAIRARTSAQNAENVAQGAKDISKNVKIMLEDAKESNANSVELKNTANELKAMAEELDSTVSKFKT